MKEYRSRYINPKEIMIDPGMECEHHIAWPNMAHTSNEERYSMPTLEPEFLSMIHTCRTLTY